MNSSGYKIDFATPVSALREFKALSSEAEENGDRGMRKRILLRRATGFELKTPNVVSRASTICALDGMDGQSKGLHYDSGRPSKRFPA